MAGDRTNAVVAATGPFRTLGTVSFTRRGALHAVWLLSSSWALAACAGKSAVSDSKQARSISTSAATIALATFVRGRWSFDYQQTLTADDPDDPRGRAGLVVGRGKGSVTVSEGTWMASMTTSTIERESGRYKLPVSYENDQDDYDGFWRIQHDGAFTFSYKPTANDGYTDIMYFQNAPSRVSPGIDVKRLWTDVCCAAVGPTTDVTPGRDQETGPDFELRVRWDGTTLTTEQGSLIKTTVSARRG